MVAGFLGAGNLDGGRRVSLRSPGLQPGACYGLLAAENWSGILAECPAGGGNPANPSSTLAALQVQPDCDRAGISSPPMCSREPVISRFLIGGKAGIWHQCEESDLGLLIWRQPCYRNTSLIHPPPPGFAPRAVLATVLRLVTLTGTGHLSNGLAAGHVC